MVNFSILRLTPVEQKVLNKLTVIENCDVPPAHFALFRRKSEGLMSQGRANRVHAIVSQVAANIKRRGPVVIADSSTFRTRDEQVGILRVGIADLDVIQPDMRNPVEEDEAIQRDAADFDMLSNPRLIQHLQPADEAYIYNMANPAAAPIRIPTVSNCRQVRRYLQSHDLAYCPELWAKNEGKHTHSQKGLSWEWLPPSGDVQGKILEFVERRTLGDYIVVLKLLRNQDVAELPEPLEIAPVGQPCCDSKCRNLQAHLNSIWPNYRVAWARRIEDGADVLSETFDNNLFVPRTNDLCVHLEMKR